MQVTSLLNLVTGLLVLWRASSGFSAAWLGTPFGMTLTLGGLLALAAAVVGFTRARPAALRLAEIGQAAAVAGGPPKPEVMAEIQRLQAQLGSSNRVVAVLLGVTVLLMASARPMLTM